MRRKSSKKSVKRRVKKPISPKRLYQTGSYHKRGTARKSIVFPPGKKSIEKILLTLQNFNWRKFDYLRYRNKPDGIHYKPPQGITVIFEIKKRKKQWTAVRISPLEFVVKGVTIRDFAIAQFKELVSDWEYKKDTIESGEDEGDEMVGSSDPENLDPRYLSAVAINFMYGK